MGLAEDTILEMLRAWAQGYEREETPLADFSNKETERFEQKVRETRVFPIISQAMPSWGKSHLEEARALEQQRTRQLAAIEMLAKAADERGIRFVLIKGIASAATCYGNIAMRESNDVDVLIDPRDIAQFDLALKSIGFSQVAQLNRIALTNKLAVKYLQAEYSSQQLPPMKRKTHDVQYQPYYSKSLGARVEVHDGMYYVPSCYVPEMLWHTRMLKLPNCSVRQFDLEHTLTALILTAYENSENIYAGFDGEANLRDYCDIMSFFKLQGRNLNRTRFSNIARKLDIEDIVKTISRNMQAIFDFTPFQEIEFRGNAMADIDQVVFLERLFDRQANRRHSANTLKKRVLRSQTVIEEGRITPVSTTNNLGVGIRMHREKSHLVAEWMLPKSIEHELPFLGLQLGVVPIADAPFVEGLATLPNADSPQNATWSTSNRVSQMLGPKRPGAALEGFESSDGSTIIIGTAIPFELIGASNCELGIVPMVYVKTGENRYRTLNTSSTHFEYPWLLPLQSR